MHHGFYLPNRVRVNLQQAVDFCQFLLGLRALTHSHPLTVLSVHLGSHDDLRLCDAHDFVPADVGVFLQLQAVLGDGHYPVGQHGQVQVCLDASVGLMVDGAHVKVALQGVEGLFHGSYHIIEFPYVHLVILVEAGQQHILAVELLPLGDTLLLALPLHGDGLFLLSLPLVGESDFILLSDGTVLFV